MSRLTRLMLAVACCAGPLLGCGWSLPTEPRDKTTYAGIKYTATTEEIISGSAALQYIVMVTLENTTDSPITRTYPAACAVRIRLYRDADDALLYDETRRTCNTTAQVTITIPPRQQTQLTSGVRFPGGLAGDSLEYRLYNVGAVPSTEGTTFVELRAGLLRLRGTP